MLKESFLIVDKDWDALCRDNSTQTSHMIFHPNLATDVLLCILFQLDLDTKSKNTMHTRTHITPFRK